MSVETTVTIIGQGLGIVVALLAAGRWIWAKRLKPWIIHQLRELQPNGGASMADRVALIPAIQQQVADNRTAADDNHAQAEEHWTGIEKRLSRVESVVFEEVAP